jgi:hypothetical protein
MLGCIAAFNEIPRSIEHILAVHGVFPASAIRRRAAGAACTPFNFEVRQAGMESLSQLPFASVILMTVSQNIWRKADQSLLKMFGTLFGPQMSVTGPCIIWQRAYAKLALVVAALWIALPFSAEARTRDDIMSSALHCAGIGDSRQWLDCYYGAAQLMRAQLGLPSAPAAQIKLVNSPPVGGQVEDQHIRDTVLANAIHCDYLDAERQWLDCYYDAASPMRARLGLPVGTASGIPMPQPVTPNATAPPQFGLMPHLPKVDGQVVSRVVSYVFDRYGIFTVTLSNGQIWRQISGDTKYAHWNGSAANYTVVISRGALGSFNLRVLKSPGLFKVERVA